MQVRFLHDPSKDTGFVGCALSSNMVRFFKTEDESWSHEVHKKDIVKNQCLNFRRIMTSH